MVLTCEKAPWNYEDAIHQKGLLDSECCRILVTEVTEICGKVAKVINIVDVCDVATVYEVLMKFDDNNY